MKYRQFIKTCGMDDMARAVIRQAGGWESFTEMAQDVNNHGADSGFHGLTYYVDTCRFYAVNRDSILAYARELAADIGEGDLMTLIAGFNCLKDSTESEIGLTLYGTKKQHDTQVANALAWFALEEVSRRYVDMIEP